MASLLQQVKPKTARGRRALADREPKDVENPKISLFLRGLKCSQVAQDCLGELFALRQALSKKFTKKNDIHPFEDQTSLEFFSEKNDASLLVFGLSSKKRPHSITFCRMFSHKTLDMLELHLDPESFRMMRQFRGRKPGVNMRSIVLFAGTAFENLIDDEYTMAKSMFLDFFRGPAGSNEDDKHIDLEGLQHIISITCDEPSVTDSTPAVLNKPVDPSSKPTIHVRGYCLVTHRAPGNKARVELQETGPRMDFRVGRSKLADPATLKQALKYSKKLEERTKKNVKVDSIGDKLGRIHLGRQNLNDLSLRKFKGLKRSRAVAEAHEADEQGDEGQHKTSVVMDEEDEAPRKKQAISS